MSSASQRPAPRRLLLPGALVLATSLVACNRTPPPGANPPSRTSAPVAPQVTGQVGDPTLPEELQPRAKAPRATRGAADAGVSPVDPTPGYDGPLFVVTSIAAAVYRHPKFERKDKIGYIRNGGRVPVDKKPVSTDNCSGGWYHVLSGGYVCGNQGTTDLNHPQVKFAIKQPDLTAILPYKYARNAKNGTPLYHSVPSRAQMNKYEPYLKSAKKARARKAREAERRRKEEGDTVAAFISDAGAPELRKHIDQALADAGVAVGMENDAGDPQADKPWWQQDDIKSKLHDMTLDQLSADSDDVLAKRMVAGFYVAIDKTFRWNGRTWYKTTKGLVAPADRFWQTSGFNFHGVELGGDWKLPIAWVFGGRKHATTYSIDDDGKMTTAGSVDKFVPLQLTGREKTIHHRKYEEMADGNWIRERYVRITRPGPPPKDLAPGERWIDVNLEEQTLVAFEGVTPVYATLVSSGRHSKIKDKDHSTPTGEYRIREKHITTTMDGDGTAAGDLPYSIEDVPYVMYFYHSYALHGAFWHRNFGVEMSHGCVNLAPLDAKYLFFFADPPLPRGFHGIWASKDHPGSRVVIHK